MTTCCATPLQPWRHRRQLHASTVREWRYHEHPVSSRRHFVHDSLLLSTPHLGKLEQLQRLLRGLNFYLQHDGVNARQSTAAPSDRTTVGVSERSVRDTGYSRDWAARNGPSLTSYRLLQNTPSRKPSAMIFSGSSGVVGTNMSCSFSL
jgi:hypothetical protein